MNNTNPMFDPATHYQIEVRGPVDVEWLQRFDSSAEITIDTTGQMGDLNVLNVYADQAGMVGLVRRLHGLGITILQLQIVPEERKPLKSI